MGGSVGGGGGGVRIVDVLGVVLLVLVSALLVLYDASRSGEHGGGVAAAADTAVAGLCVSDVGVADRIHQYTVEMTAIHLAACHSAVWRTLLRLLPLPHSCAPLHRLT